MRAALAVIVKELKLLIKDPGNLVLLFVLPAVFILVLSTALQGAFASSDDAAQIEVLVVNRDESRFGGDLIAAINEKGHFTAITTLNGKPLTEAACRAEILKGTYPIAVLLKGNLQDGVGFKAKRTIELIVDPTFSKEVTLAFKGALREFAQLSMLAGKIIEADKKGEAIDTLSEKLDTLKTGCKTCADDLTSLVSRLRKGRLPKKPPKADTDKKEQLKLLEEDHSVDVSVGDVAKSDIEATVSQIEKHGIDIVETFAYSETSKQETAPNAVQQNVPGWTIFALFWIAQILMINILYERESGAFKRVMVSPISFTRYMLAKSIPFGIINIIQAVVMFAFGIYVLPLVGCPELVLQNQPALALLTFCVSVSAIGFGLMMASLSKTFFLASSVSATVLIIMTALGGIMVPKFIMPEFMQQLSLFVPQGWALEGYLNVLVRGQSTTDILPHAAVLIAFGAAFTLFGLARMHWLNRR